MALLGAAIAAIVMGAIGISKQEITLTGSKKLYGSQATTAGIIVVAFGLVLVGVALIGIPLLISR